MPTNPTQRPLRPPPHQPWYPPYHRASQERKMNLLRWAFFTFFALLVLYPSAMVIGSLNSGHDASIVEGYRAQKERVDDLGISGKGKGVEMLMPGGGAALKGLVGQGRGVIARLFNSRDVNRLSERAGTPPGSDSWAAFEEHLDAFIVNLQPIAKLYEQGLWGVGKKEWDETVETMLHKAPEEMRRLCPDCTEKYVKDEANRIETKLQKLKSLVPSPHNGRSSKREVSKDLWADFEQQIETLGKIMDAYAKSLALLYPSNLAWKLFAKEADALISTNGMQFRNKCAAAKGCTVEDGETMAKKMIDRINKSKRFMPSLQASTSRKRENDPIGQIVLDYLDGIAIGPSLQLTATDDWIEPLGQDTDKFAQRLAKLRSDDDTRKIFNSTVETWLATSESYALVLCPLLDKACNVKVLEAEVLKLRNRLRQSASFLSSRDVSSLTKRTLPTEVWAGIEQVVDLFGKEMDALAQTLAASGVNESTRKSFNAEVEVWLLRAEEMVSCDRLPAIATPKWLNCTEQDIATFNQKIRDRARKSASILESREISPLIKRTLPPENWAFADQNIDQFGKVTDKLAQRLATLGFPTRNAFDTTVEEWIREIDVGSREQCREVKGCNEDDLATIQQKLRDRARKSASVLSSRETSQSRRRHLSPEQKAANDRQIEEIRTDIEKQAKLAQKEGTTVKFYEFTTKAAHEYEINVMSKCVKTEGCTWDDVKEEIQKLNNLYKTFLGLENFHEGNAGEDLFKRAIELLYGSTTGGHLVDIPSTEKQIMNHELAEKRSDGILLPFFHSKEIQDLAESSSQSEKRDDDFTMPDLQETFETNGDMDPDMNQPANKTKVAVDCSSNDPTIKACRKPKESDLVIFAKWGPWCILFSIISVLLLLLILKCCAACYHPRHLIPDETDEPLTPTKATSQPLLGATTRPHDEEAQMTQIPPTPMGMDGASDQEGWARKWISSKRGSELKVNKRATASIPLMESKRSVRAPRIPSLQLPKAIFHTVRAASGLGTLTEGEMRQKRGKWGSTL
ncbi:hypothetical protein HYALB_00009192 [Hymenoscyphus albidus]|uniref:Uncharacterized protein n=1 Tax=Hymenoscyphus albidus TaxID=595503 RepID=A0A9N9LRH0_9HELO|nr:hypothetical protein HYALB_00009192 [Hymenoscyphus albidus]